MTVTVCARLAAGGMLAFFWSRRENSKFPWTITKNLSIDHLMLFLEKNWPLSFRGSDCTTDLFASPHVWSRCMSSLCERQTFIGLYHHDENVSD